MTKNALKSAKGQERRANGKSERSGSENIRMPVRKKSACQPAIWKGKTDFQTSEAQDSIKQKYRIENFSDRVLSGMKEIKEYIGINAASAPSPDVPFTKPATLPSTSLEPDMYAIPVTDCTESNKTPNRCRQYESYAR